ncbi:MAG: serine/threonine protein kinase [Myxococcaceae bacterium]
MALEFGRYQLLKKIASGGMGQVFLARAAGERGFEKLLVIKRILPHLVEDEEFFTMFFDEARITARLNHPNIAQIFDLGEAGGSHYIAMEYVAGEDVRRMEKVARANDTHFPLGAVLRIIADAAAGLDYAHKARDASGQPLGLVHRDVSPQNILVGFDGGVKLIDFGVAKAAGRAQHTATGILKGKYPYMSPEQADGLAIDHRSDIFALGIVFWEQLTLKRLFKGENDVMTMRLVKDCNVPPPSKVNPELPPELDAVVLKALEKDPARRYVDCMQLRLAIEDYAVAKGIPSSSAHLVGYVQSLYADRIAQDADPANLDQLSAATDFDTASGLAAKSRNSATSGPGQAQLAGAALPKVAVAGTVALGKPGGKRGLGLAAAAIAALLVVGAVVGVPRLLAKPVDTQPLPPPEVAVKDPAPPKVVKPPPPVAVRLLSEPSGAMVSLGGRDIGSTPLDWQFDPTAAPQLVVFSHDGFEPQQASLSANDAPQRQVQLKKKPGVKKPPPPPPGLGIKTGR